MPLPSFSDWLQSRSQEPSQADRLATLIAGADVAGVSVGRLRRLVGLSQETFADLLRSLVACPAREILALELG